MQALEYINAHRQDEDPCECVILPDGSVEEPLPSHLGMLEALTGEDKVSLHAKMEQGMEPIYFLVEYTGAMLVWSTRVVQPSHPTAQQEESLENLYFAAFLAPNYKREIVGEPYESCVSKLRGKEL